jgi:tRNA (cytidine/uridine-2'-O-)-methyltransferase
MKPPAEPPYEPVLHVVLHEPAIPPNTGNIGRTCVAVGAKLWLVRPLGFELSERQLRRAGLDYWPHLNWQVVDDWEELLAHLGTHRRWLFTKHATRSYVQPRYSPGDVLVFGSETNGLPPALLRADPQQTLRIPMRSQVRSLNLAASAAVALYEAMRQIESLTDDPNRL